MTRRLALIGEPFDEATQETLGGSVEILVVAGRLAGHEHVHRMMEVVVPLRNVRARRTVAAPLEAPGLIRRILEHEMDRASCDLALYGTCELGQEVRVRIVDDRVHGVEAQTVEAVLLEPEER